MRPKDDVTRNDPEEGTGIETVESKQGHSKRKQITNAHKEVKVETLSKVGLGARIDSMYKTVGSTST